MGCVIFQCYPYGLANANAENFNGGVPLHGFVTALIVNSSDIWVSPHYFTNTIDKVTLLLRIAPTFTNILSCK